MQASACLNAASLLLQFDVQATSCRQWCAPRPARCRSRSMASLAACAQPGVVGQSQIVVGAEVEQASARRWSPSASMGDSMVRMLASRPASCRRASLVIDPGQCGGCLIAGHSLSFESWVVVDRYVLIVPRAFVRQSLPPCSGRCYNVDDQTQYRTWMISDLTDGHG